MQMDLVINIHTNIYAPYIFIVYIILHKDSLRSFIIWQHPIYRNNINPRELIVSHSIGYRI